MVRIHGHSLGNAHRNNPPCRLGMTTACNSLKVSWDCNLMQLQLKEDTWLIPKFILIQMKKKSSKFQSIPVKISTEPARHLTYCSSAPVEADVARVNIKRADSPNSEGKTSRIIQNTSLQDLMRTMLLIFLMSRTGHICCHSILMFL